MRIKKKNNQLLEVKLKQQEQEQQQQQQQQQSIKSLSQPIKNKKRYFITDNNEDYDENIDDWEN